jgi:hypothetical protein
MHLYLATGIAGASEDDRLTPDEDERLELHHLTLEQALAAIDSGGIRDAKTIVGVLWLERLVRSGEVVPVRR